MNNAIKTFVWHFNKSLELGLAGGIYFTIGMPIVLYFAIFKPTQNKPL